MNTVEVVLAVVVVATTAVGEVAADVRVSLVVAVAVLVVELVGIRPVLTRRSDRVLAGETLPRSRAHLVYVAAEVVKVAALVTSGVLALSAL